MLVARTFREGSHLSLVPSLVDDVDEGNTTVEAPRLAPPRPVPSLVPLRPRALPAPAKVRLVPPRPTLRALTGGPFEVSPTASVGEEAYEECETVELSELDFVDELAPAPIDRVAAPLATSRPARGARFYAVAVGCLAVRLGTLLGRSAAAEVARLRHRLGRAATLAALEWRRARGRAQRRLATASSR
jgi:hypothetical protein